MLQHRVRCSEGEFATSFSVLGDDQRSLAVAELSVMSWKILEKDFQTIIPKIYHSQPWYYFNRIKVPDHFQPRCAALLMYKEIAAWADQRNFNICNEISPYGPLTAEQIYRVESLFGFRQMHLPHYDRTIVTIRLAKHV